MVLLNSIVCLALLGLVTAKQTTPCTSSTTSKITTSCHEKTTKVAHGKTTTSTTTIKPKTTKTSKTLSSSSTPAESTLSTIVVSTSAAGPSSRPVQSSRAPSTGGTVGSIPPSSRYSSVSGCPLVTLTTSTAYSTTYAYDTTVTITTAPAVTVTGERTTTKGIRVVFPTTVTAPTPNATKTKLVLAPAQRTVTVPTPAGFTPVRCEATFYNPTVTRIVTAYGGTLTSTIFSGPSVTSTKYTTTQVFFIISSTGATTVYPPATETVLTRSVSVSTVYKACASNNVVADYPGGTFIKGVLPHYDVITPVNVLAAGAVDCCQLCQANSTCAGSYSISYPGQEEYCQLFIRNDLSTCSPGLQIGDADDLDGQQTLRGNYISNAACGQFDFTGVVGNEFAR